LTAFSNLTFKQAKQSMWQEAEGYYHILSYKRCNASPNEGGATRAVPHALIQAGCWQRRRRMRHTLLMHACLMLMHAWLWLTWLTWLLLLMMMMMMTYACVQLLLATRGSWDAVIRGGQDAADTAMGCWEYWGT
jgi:hypothetical protein